MEQFLDSIEQLSDTKRQLLEKLLREKAAQPRLLTRSASQTGPWPASLVQERLWFFESLMPGTSLYNIGGIAVITGQLDKNKWLNCFHRVIKRHHQLQAIFFENDGILRWDVDKEYSQDIREFDFIDKTDPIGQARNLGTEMLAEPFDMLKGPLWRLAIIRTRLDCYVVVLVLHHLISDGASTSIIFKETINFYQGGLEQPMAANYQDYCIWQRREQSSLNDRLVRLSKRLEDCPKVLEFLKYGNTLNNRESIRYELDFDVDETEELLRFAASNGITLFTVLLAGFTAAMHKLTSQSDFMIGIPTFGRDRPELSNVIGCFINLCIHRSKWSNSVSSLEWVLSVAAAWKESWADQDLPFERIVQLLGGNRDWNVSPLAQVVFSYEDHPVNSLRVPGFSIEFDEIPSKTSRYEIEVEIVRGESGLKGWVVCQSGIVSDEAAASLAVAIRTVLLGIIRKPGMPIGKIPLMGAAEEEIITLLSNGDKADYPRDHNIIQVFKRVVETHPNSIALKWRDQTWTYKQLDLLTDELACTIINEGVNSGFVAISYSRGFQTQILCLATLKAGCAYVPLDNKLPDHRKRLLLEDAHIKLVICPVNDREQWESLGVRTLSPEKWSPSEDIINRNIPFPVVGPFSPAYLMFTSGSTGRPKGVVVGHQAVLRLVVGNSFMKFSPDLCFLCHSNPSFDGSTFELWGAWANGATLVAYPYDELVIENIRAVIRSNCINTAFFTTGLFNAIADDNPGSFSDLKYAVFGGEKASRIHVEKALRACPNTIFINGYGPTESTTFITTLSIPPGTGDGNTYPIGRPISNTTIHILNSDLIQLPLGWIGQIFTGGDGLALEYIHDPDLTAKRFIFAPWDNKYRLYATGDLAFWGKDGLLYYRGRNDQQIKLRGFRIELNEIETHIASSGLVNDVLVTVVGTDEYNQNLAAYVIWKDKSDLSGLKERLRANIPEYMMPAFFMDLIEFPLNENGKVDRSRLPLPEALDSCDLIIDSSNAHVLSSIEVSLAKIWESILGISRVGASDNFFELGGHSLAAVRIIGRIKAELGYDVQLRHLFEYPVFKDFYTKTLEAKFTLPVLLHVPRGEPLPLSFAQERLWFLAQLDPEQYEYNMPSVITIKGEVDIERLRESFKTVFGQHEFARSRFCLHDGKPVVAFTDESIYEPEFVSFNGDLENQIELMNKWMNEDACRPFKLDREVIRCRVYLVNSQTTVIYFNMHHIVSDGWSVNIIFKEWSDAYAGITSQEFPIFDYADFSVWQRNWINSDAAKIHLEFWLKYCDGEPGKGGLPIEKARSMERSRVGDRISIPVPLKLSSRLRNFAENNQLTEYQIIFAAWAFTMLRCCDQKDIIIGTPTNGRTLPEAINILGFFVNTLPVRFKVEADMTFQIFLNTVKENLLEVIEHQEYPLELLIDELGLERKLNEPSLFNSVFTYQNLLANHLSLPGMDCDIHELYNQTCKFDLMATWEPASWDNQDDWQLTLEYCTALYSETRIMKFAEWFLEGFDRLLIDSSIRFCHYIPWASQLNDIIEIGQNTRLIDASATVISLVDYWVINNKDAIALECDGVKISYGELGERSNRLALFLREDGAKKGDFIGVHLSRNSDLIITFLACLRLGACFVPIDLEYPLIRKQQLAELAGLLRIVGTPFEVPLGMEIQFIDPSCVGKDSSGSLIDEGDPEFPAYVMFTSGSTGVPKGVIVPQRGICRLVRNNGFFDIQTDDRVLQISHVSFDASTLEIWGALCNGARLVLFDRATPSVDDISRLIQTEEITIAWFTAGLFHVLVEHALLSMNKLRICLAGGDVLSPEAVNRFLASNSDVILINGYGPTENTTFTTCMPLNPGPWNCSIPIGKPIGNTTIYVLDSLLTPVPIGFPGRLFTGGAGLACGYLGDLELTKLRFISFPWYSNERLYDTGDLAQWNQNGYLEFLGRADDQVKIRGYRIELGEIEKCLMQIPYIRQSFVCVKENEIRGKQIYAYVVHDKECEHSSTEIRNYLSDMVPEYLIPHYIIPIQALPLNKNGKVDKALLPEPVFENERMYETNEVDENINQSLREIWKKLLGLDNVHQDQNFFESGGDSIMSIQLVAKANEMGLGLTPKDVFINPTLGGLEAVVRSNLAMIAPQEPIVGTFPLMPIQKWFFDLNMKQPNHWNLSVLLKLKPEINPELVASAFTYLYHHHDQLRAIFAYENEQWVQRILPIEENLDMPQVDEIYDNNEIDNWILQSQAGLDIQTGPVSQCRLVRLYDTVYLLAVFHHLVMDGVSWRILLEDLESVYFQLLLGEKPSLPRKTTPYGYFAKVLSEEVVIEKSKAFWDRVCSNNQPYRIPDVCNKAENCVEGVHTVSFEIDSDITYSLLKEIPERHKIAINEFILICLFFAIKSDFGTDDIVVRLEHHGRNELNSNINLTRTVGWFTSLYPIALKEVSDTLAGFLAAKEEIKRSSEHGFNFSLLRSSYDSDWSTHDSDIVFNYLGQFDNMLDNSALVSGLGDQNLHQFGFKNIRTAEIEVSASVIGGCLRADCLFHPSRLDSSRIENWFSDWKKCIERWVNELKDSNISLSVAADFGAVDLSQNDLDNILIEFK